MSIQKSRHKKPSPEDSNASTQLGLFSPATFYDVVARDLGPDTKNERLGPLPRPAIVAFYGFRGGAGRTVALAHVAVALARRGLGVAAIDLDLEAPGLHVVLGVQPIPDKGAAYLLRQAFLASPDERSKFDASAHLTRNPDVDDLWIVPAGAVDRKYLATLEELNVPAWHLAAAPHPLRIVVDAIGRAVPKLDVVLVDCRTGFHPMAATTLFHAADAIVLCTSLSPQVWEGVGVFLEGVAISRSLRGGVPILLVLRSMVPPGDLGDQLAADFAVRFRKEHDERIGPLTEDEAAELEDPARAPWELGPVKYDADIAAKGCVDLKRDVAFERYRSLSEAIARSIGADLDDLTHQRVASLDRRRVLDEFDIPKSYAFAEEISPDLIEQLFVKSSRHARIEEQLTTLIIGAKGAGKSLFWRWLIRRPAGPPRFIAGHAPRRATNLDERGALTMSADALKELERSAQLTKNGTHKAFWTYYAVARIANAESAAQKAADIFEGSERTLVRDVLRSDDMTALQTALNRILKLPNAGTLAEKLLAEIDRILSSAQRPRVTLVYDGLDDGFDIGADAEGMRQRYVVALLQLLSDIRGRYHCVSLKVFLREDIWELSALQNRSHLEAGRVDLRWEIQDLWMMTLKLVRTSRTYANAVPAPTDNMTVDELERFLEPLWGRLTGGKATAKTANYVKNRMADGLGRYFPRTLVQMLETAVDHEKKMGDAEVGRIIRLRSLQAGIENASKARVKDLETEYTFLAPYLKLFTREQPTGSAEEFRNRLQRKYASSMRPKKGTRKTPGVQRGALHAGAGGWMKVVDFLLTVGVLGKRPGGENRLQVALLYRPGLGIPSYGG